VCKPLSPWNRSGWFVRAEIEILKGGFTLKPQNSKKRFALNYLPGGVPKFLDARGNSPHSGSQRDFFQPIELLRCKPVQTREGNSIDWDSVRMDYETKSISDRALAKNVGVSDTALRKRARKGRWVKLMDCAPATEPACKPERNPRPTSLPRPMRLAETGNPSQAARRGAKTRSGAPCKSAPVMSNARWRRRQWCTEGNQKRQL
jgi:hypothetical protein